MSRIILTEYNTGEQHFVVGWDHPCAGAFWQEFNREPAPDPKTGIVDWEKADSEGWEEVLRDGGVFRGLPLDKFKESIPENLTEYVTEEVLTMLQIHALDGTSESILDRSFTKKES